MLVNKQIILLFFVLARWADPALFTPSTFYIAAVTDHREHKGEESILLSKFINDRLPKNLSLNPVIIDVKELSVKETAGKSGTVEGQIKLQLAFSLKKDYGTQHLVNCSGGVRYSRFASDKPATEQNIKRAAKSALVFFNNWMNTNINTSKTLASGVRFHFDYFEDKKEGDTIYYSTSRPLGWADFKSTRRMSNKYAAVVMPSIGYDQQEEIINGVIHVTITLKTYLAKSDCWLGSSYRDNVMLNHEQRHFDIARIATDHFRQKIESAQHTPDTYEATINMQYLDSYRYMNKLQKDYDTETAHGLNSTAQQNWNTRIDGMLKIAMPEARVSEIP